MSDILPRPQAGTAKIDKLYIASRDEAARLNNVKQLSLDDPLLRKPVREEPKQSYIDLNVALEVLGRASDAMDVMYNRSQKMEILFKKAVDKSKADLAAAEAQIKEWEDRARAGEAQLQACEARLKDTERRAETAERHAETADRNAQEAREWLKRYYDKIIELFGPHSQLSLPAAAA